MNKSSGFIVIALVTLLSINISACTPEVGSEKWCTNLKGKQKSDWTMNEAADYAQHCIIK